VKLGASAMAHWRFVERAALPGDGVVAARWQTTRAVSVAAPARQVWPWLVQMGYGRGGWYSYDRLERLVGAGEFTDGVRPGG